MPLRSKEQAFREFKAGTLHSGKGGPVVKSKKQATAIALSTERRMQRPNRMHSASSKKSRMSRSPMSRRSR